MRRSRSLAVSLVLLDLTMPRMNGAETLRLLRALNPRLPVILMSGYAADQMPTEPGPFLPKPFTLEALSDLLQQVTEQRLKIG